MNKVSPITSKRTTTAVSETNDVKSFKSEKSNLLGTTFIKKPEDIILCERQEKHFCGRHALRALTQRRDLFSDQYLIEVGQNVAAAEQIIREGDEIRLTEYYYEKTGDYDIQILKAALMNIFSIELLQIHTLETNNCFYTESNCF